MSMYIKLYPIESGRKTCIVDYLYGKICLIDAPISYVEDVINNKIKNKTLIDFFESNNFISTQARDRAEINKILNREKEKFYLTIVLTEDCNLDCIYCYQKRKKNTMSDTVFAEIERMIYSNIIENYKYLRIIWFGGEPLLHWKGIVKFSNNILKEVNKNINLDHLVVTNGVFLTEEVVLKLYEVGITKYQITIDGDKESHNKVRLSKAYPNTYDSIINNIIHTIQLNLNISLIIRINITNEFDFDRFNCEEIKKINNSSCTVFSFHIAKDFYGSGIKELISVDEEAKYLLNIYRKAIQNEFNTDASKFFNVGGLSCYSGDQGSIVIYPDGKMCKCTVEDCRDFNINIFKYNQVENLFKEWTNINSECINCEFFPQCLGNGCPRRRLITPNSSCFEGKVATDDIRKVYLENQFEKGTLK